MASRQPAGCRRYLHRSLGLESPVHYQFGMQAAESLGHVAVPAHRLVSGENIGKLFRPKLAPLGGLEIRAQQCRRVIQVTKLADLLVAERAALPFVPLRDDVPDQAVGGTDLNLAQAFLAAILALGPTRTFFQAQRWLSEEGSDGGFTGG